MKRGPEDTAATPVRATTDRPHAPWALTPQDMAWGAAVMLLSVGMFVVTPSLAVLRRLGFIELGLGWIFLPAALCVLAVFLHGVAHLIQELRRG